MTNAIWWVLHWRSAIGSQQKGAAKGHAVDAQNGGGDDSGAGAGKDAPANQSDDLKINQVDAHNKGDSNQKNVRWLLIPTFRTPN